MELLDEFARVGYSNEIDPGGWANSPRVPGEAGIGALASS